MTKLTHNLGMKVFACFLVILMGFTALISGLGIVTAGESGFYGNRPLSYGETPYCQSTTYAYAEQVMDWLNSNMSLKEIAEQFDAGRTNFRFELFSPKNEPILSNFDKSQSAATYVGEYRFSLYYDYGNGILVQDEDNSISIIYNAEIATEEAVAYSEPVLATIRCYVADPLTVSDNYWISYRLYQFTYDFHFWLIPILAGSVLLLIAGMIYLLCAAGHQVGKEEIVPNLLDKVPLDLYLGMISVPLLYGLYIDVNGRSMIFNIYEILFGVAYIFFLGILLLATILTCATRLKLGRYFYQNTITYKVLHFGWKLFAAVFSTGMDALKAIPAMWKVAVAWLVISSVYVGGGFGAILLNLALMFVFCLMASQAQKLQEGGEALAKGKLNHKIDTRKMFSMFRKHGDNLNSISKGFSIALEQKMKSEHLKTELITNVSHDIKTPLTSIINYVDLLKKEGLEGQAAEYIEVLDRQSHRLKKLTEDLVEASKASTGNLKVNLAPTDMGELVAQAVAEYEERLEKADLKVVLNGLESPTFAMVDGNLTWRVLSNLLSNACKYSQTGTRVYIDLKKEAGSVTVSMKNISKDALNIPADELMERFVRGDSSRHTEGSGLGLNIAQSLVGLQKGKFSLEIEGDLFKAYMKFPATEPPAPPAEEPPGEEPLDDVTEELTE
ncbi:histidine kinase dimerization/phospho-acceptor domain-containing protein [Anaerotignum sp.]